MNIEKIQTKAQETMVDLSRYAHEHAELARDHYEDYTERHGHPVEELREEAEDEIEDVQERVLELSDEVNQQTELVLLELTEQTSHVARKVDAEAQHVTRELGERFEVVSRLVEEQLDTTPEIETGSVSVPDSIASAIRVRPVGNAREEPNSAV
jgi:ElaB/YqjD/DUF883 family membrane-anchored ribosome-binding protein